MIPLSIAKLAEITQGKINNVANPDEIIEQMPEIDSRKIDANHFFVALVGEHLDGHDYVDSAIAAGAKLAFVSRAVNAPSILVDDVTQALAEIATYVRGQLSGQDHDKGFSCPHFAKRGRDRGKCWLFK